MTCSHNVLSRSLDKYSSSAYDHYDFSFLGWKKGIAFLNNKNLGKYWPRIGPQMTLYVPGVWLKPPCQKNTIVLFEQEYHECGSGSPFIELTNQHVINGTTPTNSKSMKLFHKTF